MTQTPYDAAADLLERAQQAGDLELLDRALDQLRRIAEGPRTDHGEHTVVLSALGVALHTRHSWTGRPDDLDEAVAVANRAANESQPGHPHHAAVLANLANTLRIRFESAGDPADLGRAIEIGQRAAELPSADPGYQIVILNNLGICLRLRFQAAGDRADIDDAITNGKRCVDAMPRGYPDRAAVLSNLAGSYQARFERTGEPADLDRAIGLGRQAAESAPPHSPHRARVLSNLCAALQIRSERTGDSADLDGAIVAGSAAADATPTGHPELPGRLTNLSAALQTRFDRAGARSDLDVAVHTAQQAVDATRHTDPARGGRQSNLAAALRARFEAFGDPHDVDRAITAAMHALASAPPGHLARPGYLSNYGVALRARFRRSRDLSDAAQAADALNQAVAASPADHPDRAVLLSNLGGTLYDRFELVGGEHLPRQATDAFRRAAAVATARPRVRVASAAAWGRIAAELFDWPDALAGLGLAVGLLGRVAPRDLAEEDQQWALARHTAIASDAAACALQLGDPEQAVALLEQGRGLLLSQAIDTRGELTDLRRAAPELAERFERLRRRLDIPTTVELGRSSQSGRIDEQAAKRRQIVVEELNATVAQIRSVPGFTHFLRPPRIPDLLRLAANGPVVAVNISHLRSDALIISPDGVRTASLSQATPEAVRAHTAALAASLGDHQDNVNDGTDAVLTDVLDWLWEAVARPVLNTLDLSSNAGLGRLWWMPTGLLSLLPLHAAQPADATDGLLDRVISSYTPTLRTLSFARRASPAAQQRVLAVAPAIMSGQPPLPASDREVAFLRGLIPAQVDVLAGADATRTAVRAALPAHSWLHIAAHAETNLTVPSRGALLLPDSDGALLTVADVARLRLTNANLAYLSACATAHTPAQLADEAVHITSAFQLAGYRHVVGTLWPVTDGIALRFARAFYPAVASAVGLRPDQAPAALHAASRKVRRRLPRRPSAWALHIHAGA